MIKIILLIVGIVMFLFILILGCSIIHELAHYALFRIFDRKSHAIIAIKSKHWFNSKSHIIKKGKMLDIIVVENNKLNATACIEFEHDTATLTDFQIIMLCLVGPVVNALTMFVASAMLFTCIGLASGLIIALITSVIFAVVDFIWELFFSEYSDWKGVFFPARFRNYVVNEKKYARLETLYYELVLKEDKK